MRRFNGTYVEEFNDPEYESCLEVWQKGVGVLAEKFYQSPLNIEDARVLPSQVSYQPNHLLIHRAVINAFSDIKRIKEYHKIGNVETIKFVAYVGYWLTRAKPFHLKIGEYAAPVMKKGVLQQGTFNFCVSINETFITDFILATIFRSHVASEILSANETCLHMRNDHGFKVILQESVIESLHYYLCYRLRSAQELELFLKGLLACPIDCLRAYRKQ